MDKKVALQIHHDKNWREKLKVAAESGFKYVAMGFSSDSTNDKQGNWIYSGDRSLESDDWEKEINAIGEEIAKNGLKCIQTHAPYYCLWSPVEETIEIVEKSFLRCMKATNMLGAEICAVHPKGIYGKDGAEKSFVENLRQFSPMVEEISKGGGMLGIENLPWDQYCRNTEDHVKLIDAFHSENVCGVWDFGHSHLVDYDKAQAIREVGKRIKGTHVHANWGTHGLDIHLPPLLGTIDWDNVLSALKESDYNGYLTLEVDTDPEKSMPSFMKYLYDSICVLWEKFQKA